MAKDSNIRITSEGRKMLRRVAKKEGRTLKRMFDIVVTAYEKEVV